jgi:endonuclease YncB( thermonuclease family)
MNISLIYGAILAAICLLPDTCAAASTEDGHFIPDCAGTVVIAHTRLARVDDDGALILADGRSLRLEGVRLPLADNAASGQALAALRDLALSGPVRFTTAAPQKDRYGRMRVQGFGKLWLQAALLEQGWARVQIAPDRSECAPDLYEAEARARDRHAGIWALPAYAVRAPQTLKGTTGTFQLMEGQVSNIGHADGRTFIDFGAPSDNRRLFSAVIGSESRRAFRDFDFDELSGHRVRIRGIVQDYRGRPEIVLSNPAQIEMLN